MAFTRVVNGNITDDDDLNQIIGAWEGDADGGSHPLLLTQVNDAASYAEDIRQLDNTVGLIARWRNYNDESVLRLTKDNVILGKNTTLAAGILLDSLFPKLHNHTGAMGMGTQLAAASILNRTRTLHVPVEGSYFTPGASGPSVSVIHEGWLLPTAIRTDAVAHFRIPDDYASDGQLLIILTSPEQTEQIKGSYQVDFGHDLEAWSAGLYEEVIYSLTAGLGWAAPTLPFPLMRTGDFVRATFTRLGADASDHITTDVYLHSFAFTYTADM